MDWFKAGLGVAVILVAHHLIKTDRIGFSAETYNTPAINQKFDDYGSLELPANLLHKGVGKAAGQMNTPYGADESMTVMSIGQNYNGRAFGF